MAIYLIGDIHGNSKIIKNFYKEYKEILDKEENILICLGDFGANYFFNHRDDEFKTELGKYPFTYFTIRGNHEERAFNCFNKNKDKWTSEVFFHNFVYVEKEYPYIKYALDFPANYIINGLKTIIFPGAYSIDKEYRLMSGWSWFPEEQLTEQEKDLGRYIAIKDTTLGTAGQFDLVLSHTCPIIFEPTNLFLSFIDQSTVDKTMERYLGEIENQIKYKAWCWGHYHGFKDYPRDIGKATFDNPRRLMLYQNPVKFEDIFSEKYIIKQL